jgi:hypothetical protein
MVCPNEFDLDEGESFQIFKLQFFLCLSLLKLIIQVWDGFIHMYFPSYHQSKMLYAIVTSFFHVDLFLALGFRFC